MAPLKFSYVAPSKLSYKALSKHSYRALLKQSCVALLYPSSLVPDLSYAALSFSSPREGGRGFNAVLWRIGTDCVAFQASRFLYK